jgi:hypothetical protein
MGCEQLGVARQLFDAEQISAQRRVARVWAQTHMPGQPALKAQWQSLHVFLTFSRDFCSQSLPQDFILIGGFLLNRRPLARPDILQFRRGRLFEPYELTLPR